MLKKVLLYVDKGLRGVWKVVPVVKISFRKDFANHVKEGCIPGIWTHGLFLKFGDSHDVLVSVSESSSHFYPIFRR